ncbi:unnamed protein product [Miscanthus lutarioriparius]|uniref:Annexin n=1 Tax=Miscanthus lutarioriparius TaxID=422564 RepID=A0A811Q0M1_9POAL|nr:unnamed protein product [Miscanthus lutarioriparius]
MPTTSPLAHFGIEDMSLAGWPAGWPATPIVKARRSPQTLHTPDRTPPPGVCSPRAPRPPLLPATYPPRSPIPFPDPTDAAQRSKRDPNRRNGDAHRPSSVPAVAEDCEQLHKAFEGWGTNEELIISILAHRNAAQRRAIRRAYADVYGKELLRALGDEIHGKFEGGDPVDAGPAERDAVLANEEAKKWHPGGRALVEIACARTPAQLFAAKQAYHDRFKRSLEEDVAAHVTGDFRKLLVPLVSAYRYDGPEVNTSLAHSEAKILHEKIDKKAYSDEEIIRILTTRSKAQLLATFNSYKDQFGHAINKDLKADPKDEFLATLRAIIRCFTCPDRYFEKLIRLALGGVGTDEDALTRVITTRAEVDLKLIKEAYQKRNSVPLERAVAKDTTRDYEDILLALLGAE